MVESARARILIIDDEEGIRLSLKGILEEDEGHAVLEAASAEEGLEVIARELPDLVFLDIWLPGMDGMDALIKIKERHPLLPVI
ncbi:MAG: response regulator, partial [Desulfovibrionaceae bacterium]|nr:response regulator [Desulfovibrionaceae bacterium]